MSGKASLSKGPKEKAIDAIRTGKQEEAVSYVEELYNSFKPLHDRYCDMVSLLLTYIGQKLGEEAVYEATRLFMYEIYPLVVGKLKGASHEQLVKAICRMHAAHYTEFHLVDDDDKTTVAITGCRSGGGRLLRDGQPPLAKKEGVTEQARHWSFNRVGFPYYCVHASPLNDIFKEAGVPVEIQWGRQYDEKGNPIDEPCKYVIYKEKTK